MRRLNLKIEAVDLQKDYNAVYVSFCYQITGPSGCGKTQLCIMMSLLATLPTNMGGLDGAVIYIDTESAFTAER